MIAPTRGTDWTPFKGTEALPEQLHRLMIKNDMFRGCGSWLIGTVFYKGDINTTQEWIVVTDDGSYYKHRAEYCFWRLSANYDTVRMQCCWTGTHLKRTIKNFIKCGETLPDPNYHT